MSASTFVMYDNIVPLLAPVDITTTVTATAYVDLKYAHRAGILCTIGNIHSGTATDIGTVTVEGATAPGGTEAAIAFKYRLAGAVGANTWGNVTTASASVGVDFAITDDNKALWIELDPADLAASDYRYVRVKFSDDPDLANWVVGAYAFLQTRFKQHTHLSATAAASA
jgi:hypothetical protein